MPNLIFFFRKPHSHSTHKYIIMLRVTAQRALRRATASLRNGNTTATSNNAKQQLQKRSMSGGGSIEEEIGRQSFFFFLSLPIIFSFSLSPDERVTIEKRSLSLTYSSIVITAEMNKWRTVTFLAIPACGAFGVYSFANAEHGHGEEQPAYSYLKRRSREQWPWGGDLGLFEYPKEDGGHH